MARIDIGCSNYCFIPLDQCGLLYVVGRLVFWDTTCYSNVTVFSLLLAHLPYKTLPVFGLLTTLSIGQMLIVCASNVLVPDKVIQTIARLDFFSYSTIYNECLQMLQHGNFAWNMGNAWFGLSSWVSLIPLILLIGIVTILIWRLSQMDEMLSVQV
jgi:hypothetical protein